MDASFWQEGPGPGLRREVLGGVGLVASWVAGVASATAGAAVAAVRGAARGVVASLDDCASLNTHLI